VKLGARPVVIGLTGSIAMGKSAVGQMFRHFGIPVFEADRAVHTLLGPGGKAVERVAAEFPGVRDDDAIDRQALGRQVFGDQAAIRRLEAILHPLVRRTEEDFLRRVTRRRAPAAVLDIPLLFETGGEDRCDVTVVVSAPPFVQVPRALRRKGMTREKLEAILRQQMPDREKQRRADYIVPTGLGKRFSRETVAAILNEVIRKNKNRYGRMRTCHARDRS